MLVLQSGDCVEWKNKGREPEQPGVKHYMCCSQTERLGGVVNSPSLNLFIGKSTSISPHPDSSQSLSLCLLV